jgi:hypothetical protein
MSILPFETMGEGVYLSDHRSAVAIENIESILDKMQPSSEDMQGKEDVCLYSIENRKRDLGTVSLYLRAKESFQDYQQLRELGRNLKIEKGYDFLEKHLLNCKRCLRTLKIGLEQKPRLDDNELGKIAEALLLSDSEKKKVLVELSDLTALTN